MRRLGSDELANATKGMRIIFRVSTTYSSLYTNVIILAFSRHWEELRNSELYIHGNTPSSSDIFYDRGLGINNTLIFLQ